MPSKSSNKSSNLLKPSLVRDTNKFFRNISQKMNTLKEKTIFIITPVKNESALDLFYDLVFKQRDLNFVWVVIYGNLEEYKQSKLKGIQYHVPIVSIYVNTDNLAEKYQIGQEYAWEHGADAVLELDAWSDWTWLNFIESLYYEAEGLVTGRRYQYTNKWRRRILSLGGTWLGRLLFSSKIKDYTSGPTFYKYRLPPVCCKGYFYQTERRLQAQLLGLDILEADINNISSNRILPFSEIYESLKLMLYYWFNWNDLRITHYGQYDRRDYSQKSKCSFERMLKCFNVSDYQVTEYSSSLVREET